MSRAQRRCHFCPSVVCHTPTWIPCSTPLLTPDSHKREANGPCVRLGLMLTSEVKSVLTGKILFLVTPIHVRDVEVVMLGMSKELPGLPLGWVKGRHTQGTTEVGIKGEEPSTTLLMLDHGKLRTAKERDQTSRCWH